MMTLPLPLHLEMRNRLVQATVFMVKITTQMVYFKSLLAIITSVETNQNRICLSTDNSHIAQNFAVYQNSNMRLVSRFLKLSEYRFFFF